MFLLMSKHTRPEQCGAVVCVSVIRLLCAGFVSGAKINEGAVRSRANTVVPSLTRALSCHSALHTADGTSCH